MKVIYDSDACYTFTINFYNFTVSASIDCIPLLDIQIPIATEGID